MKDQTSLGFTSGLFPPGTHMCYIYNDEQERRRTMAKYIESGVSENELVGYFADIMSPDEMELHLKDIGISVPEKAKQGQVFFAKALDTYCPDGHFDPEKMLANFPVIYQKSLDMGFSASRATGEMTWALRGVEGSDRLIEYEAKINLVVRTAPMTAICQYNASKFDGATLFEVLSVHPMMVIRGQVFKNPYYIPPEEFLGRLAHK